MALYSELPVYKSLYKVLLDVVGMSRSWQRDCRYTLGQELKQELIDMMVLVYRANSHHDKHDVIGEAREKTERVKIYIRLLRDMKQIGDKQYTRLMDDIGSISKQLARWHAKYTPGE